MIGESCVAHEQCTGSGQTSFCRGHVCTCQEGYITHYSRCYQGNSSWFEKKEKKNILKMYI